MFAYVCKFGFIHVSAIMGDNILESRCLIEMVRRVEGCSSVELLFQLQKWGLLKPYERCRNHPQDEIILVNDLQHPLGKRAVCSICGWYSYVYRCDRRHRRLNMELRAYAGHSFGLRYYCTKCCYSKTCLEHSFFAHSNIPIKTHLYFMYAWAINMKGRQFKDVLGIQWEATTQWAQYLRDVCSKQMLQIRGPGIVAQVQLGGVGHIVQIDEAMLTKRKNNVGRVPRQEWVMGLYDHQSGQAVVLFIPDRTARTLEAKIREYVAPGSRIWTDGWAAYGGIVNIPGMNYLHETVVHATNFVDSVTGCCTNAVEGLWSRFRRFIRGKGVQHTTLNFLQSYTDEFMWRLNYEDKRPHITFKKLVEHMVRFYGF